MIVSNAFLDMI